MEPGETDNVKEKEIVIRKDFNFKKKDAQIKHLTEQIEARRELLLNKQKHIEMASQQNEFLHMVRDDYREYYGAIAKQKQEQVDALQTLNKYVTDLKHSEDISDAHINEITKDQMRIIKEMQTLRKSIQSLIR